MAISPQQLTIYLYSAHRAVIFAIDLAQLSCFNNIVIPRGQQTREFTGYIMYTKAQSIAVAVTFQLNSIVNDPTSTVTP